MLKSPLFTIVGAVAFLILCGIITMQVLEMRSYGMTPLDFFK